MMNFSFHENLAFSDLTDKLESLPRTPSTSFGDDSHFFYEKLRVPELKDQLPRPRLIKLLKKSLHQYGSTFIVGRAGTGKTALAAEYSRAYSRVAWYKIEAAETDWGIFSRYFVESFGGDKVPAPETGLEIAQFVEHLFAALPDAGSGEPLLVVLDDIHCIFDAEWFADFFQTLIFAHSANVHLLLLSRCTPAFPLWRLRSKQALGVIDEKLLAFNACEIAELFKQSNVAIDVAGEDLKSFSRISKLKELISLRSNLSGQ